CPQVDATTRERRPGTEATEVTFIQELLLLRNIRESGYSIRVRIGRIFQPGRNRHSGGWLRAPRATTCWRVDAWPGWLPAHGCRPSAEWAAGSPRQTSGCRARTSYSHARRQWPAPDSS